MDAGKKKKKRKKGLRLGAGIILNQELTYSRHWGKWAAGACQRPHIHAASQAEQYIARALTCDISYVPEGASPRTTYFRISRRARRARVLYDTSTREARRIWILSTSGRISRSFSVSTCLTTKSKRFRTEVANLRKHHAAYGLIRCRTGQNN